MCNGDPSGGELSRVVGVHGSQDSHDDKRPQADTSLHHLNHVVDCPATTKHKLLVRLAQVQSKDIGRSVPQGSVSQGYGCRVQRVIGPSFGSRWQQLALECCRIDQFVARIIVHCYNVLRAFVAVTILQLIRRF